MCVCVCVCVFAPYHAEGKQCVFGSIIVYLGNLADIVHDVEVVIGQPLLRHRIAWESYTGEKHSDHKS